MNANEIMQLRFVVITEAQRVARMYPKTNRFAILTATAKGLDLLISRASQMNIESYRNVYRMYILKETGL